MPTAFFLTAPEGPLCVRRGGRDVTIARYPQDVTTWTTRRGADSAREQMQAFRVPGVADVSRVCVVEGDDEARRVATVEAERNRTLGMSEATILRMEVAGARAALSMAPYTVEMGDVVAEVTVEAAKERLAKALVAVEAAPPEVRRWL